MINVSAQPFVLDLECYCWAVKGNQPYGRTNYKKKEQPEGIGELSERARTVDSILKKMETKLTKDDAKATLGDYIRLVQLQKELEDEQPREIKVSWIESEETESGSGE